MWLFLGTKKNMGLSATAEEASASGRNNRDYPFLLIEAVFCTDKQQVHASLQTAWEQLCSQIACIHHIIHSNWSPIGWIHTCSRKVSIETLVKVGQGRVVRAFAIKKKNTYTTYFIFGASTELFVKPSETYSSSGFINIITPFLISTFFRFSIFPKYLCFDFCLIEISQNKFPDPINPTFGERITRPLRPGIIQYNKRPPCCSIPYMVN